MPWPERYRCPDCGNTITRPTGAHAWGCHCTLGPKCSCRFLDAAACYRCGTAAGFPRHDRPPMTEEALNRSIVLHANQTAWERGYTVKELNEKRRVYCDRCIHEGFFLHYTDTTIICRLCGAHGPRGATLTHADGLTIAERKT